MVDFLSWIAPNFFSRRHTLTRPLDCLAGRLNNKNSQEPGVLPEINISSRNTCNIMYAISARESISSKQSLAHALPIGDYARLTRKRHNGGGGMTGFVFVRMRRLWSSYVIGIGAPRRNEAGGSK